MDKTQLQAATRTVGQAALEADRDLVAAEEAAFGLTLDDEQKIQTFGALSRELWKAQSALLAAGQALSQLETLATRENDG